MKTIVIFSILLFLPLSVFAKNKYPAAKAQFLTKNVWNGKTKVSYVKFYCFMNECTWREVEIDGCFANTAQIFINFFPFIDVYSTAGDMHLAEKMTVKTVSKDVFSVSLGVGRDVTTEYVVTLKCTDKDQLTEPGCEVKSVTGSMIGVNSQRTTYDLVDVKNIKDLKLDRCVPVNF